MDPINLSPANPARQDDAELHRLRMAMRWLLLWAVLAPLAWVMLALLMALLQQEQEGEPAFSWSALANGIRDPAFQAPMRLLAWNTADALFWPVIAVVVFVLLRGGLGELLIRRRFGRKDEAAADGAAQGQWRLMTLGLHALRIIPFALTGCAAAWVFLVGLAAINGRDHREALPWVTSPDMGEFLARHPKLIVERLGQPRGNRMLRDGQGHSIRLERDELAGADVRFESCPPQLGAEQLGGIPPYPGMTCATLVHLHNTYGEQRFYVFDVAKGSDGQAIYAHFARWADAYAGSRASSTGGSQLYLMAFSRDDAWRLEVESRQGGTTSVVIRYRPEPAR